MIDYKAFFNNAVREHLERAYMFDFVHEVLEVFEWKSDAEDPTTCVAYRGVHGEYATLRLDSVSLTDFLKEL